MKNLLLSALMCFTIVSGTFAQVTLVDYETVTDPFLEPFDLVSYEGAVANPDGAGSVGKIVKAGWAAWGGTNIYLGGDVQFNGTGDTVFVDFYTEAAPANDTIRFQVQLFNRVGGVETQDVSAYYIDANDTQTGVWKTLKFPLADGLSAGYNQMVIFFGWEGVGDGEIVYFDNIVAPGYTAYGNTNVTFTVTDKFNNATDVKLFVDGTEKTLTQSSNEYSYSESFAPYSVLVGETVGFYEVVWSHMANGTEVRDTFNLLAGDVSGAQEMTHLIIVESPEDGTAKAITVGSTPPTIDGAVDAIWSNAATHSLQQRSWWGTPTGLYSTFKLMWDINNIYILVTVEDATPHNSNTTVYENDCVELYFDMNQSATTPYDADDYQIRTIRGLDTWTGSANVEAAGWSDPISRGMVTDDNGYVVEIAIPWSSLTASFLPIETAVFNFDISTADVTADLGARTFRESWTTAEDKAYMNTEDFGTITLANEESSAINTNRISDLNIYPNPANEQVTIVAGAMLSSVSIMDITGRVVNHISSVNGNSTVVSVDNLQQGIYIISVIDENGLSSSQKIRVY